MIYEDSLWDHWRIYFQKYLTNRTLPLVRAGRDERRFPLQLDVEEGQCCCVASLLPPPTPSPYWAHPSWSPSVQMAAGGRWCRRCCWWGRRYGLRCSAVPMWKRTSSPPIQCSHLSPWVLLAAGGRWQCVAEEAGGENMGKEVFYLFSSHLDESEEGSIPTWRQEGLSSVPPSFNTCLLISPHRLGEEGDEASGGGEDRRGIVQLLLLPVAFPSLFLSPSLDSSSLAGSRRRCSVEEVGLEKPRPLSPRISLALWHPSPPGLEEWDYLEEAGGAGAQGSWFQERFQSRWRSFQGKWGDSYRRINFCF